VLVGERSFSRWTDTSASRFCSAHRNAVGRVVERGACFSEGVLPITSVVFSENERGRCLRYGASSGVSDRPLVHGTIWLQRCSLQDPIYMGWGKKRTRACHVWYKPSLGCSPGRRFFAVAHQSVATFPFFSTESWHPTAHQS
jgi:hypothetical protein